MKKKYYNKKNEQFEKDLGWGSYWEVASAPFVEDLMNKAFQERNIGKKIFCTYIKNESNKLRELREWDIKYIIKDIEDIINLYGKSYKFEIKADKYVNTGNVAIENRYKKNESGLNTKADYFVYVMPRYKRNNIYIAKSETLRKFVEEHFPNKKLMGGDNKKAELYIIKKVEFDFLFKKHKVGLIGSYDMEIPESFYTLMKGDKIYFEK